MEDSCCGQESFPYPCSVENYILAVREYTDRPRRQVILRISKGHFCRRFRIIICKECSTSSRLCLIHMSLETTTMRNGVNVKNNNATLHQSSSDVKFLLWQAFSHKSTKQSHPSINLAQ